MAAIIIPTTYSSQNPREFTLQIFTHVPYGAYWWYNWYGNEVIYDNTEGYADFYNREFPLLEYRRCFEDGVPSSSAKWEMIAFCNKIDLWNPETEAWDTFDIPEPFNWDSVQAEVENLEEEDSPFYWDWAGRGYWWGESWRARKLAAEIKLPNPKYITTYKSIYDKDDFPIFNQMIRDQRYYSAISDKPNKVCLDIDLTVYYRAYFTARNTARNNYTYTYSCGDYSEDRVIYDEYLSAGGISVAIRTEEGCRIAQSRVAPWRYEPYLSQARYDLERGVTGFDPYKVVTLTEIDSSWLQLGLIT
jgi:hypothetical protein